MIIKKHLLAMITIGLLLFSLACKTKAKPEITSIWGMGEYFIDDNQSRFYVEVNFLNKLPGIEIKMRSWTLRLLQDNTLLWEFTAENYKSFSFPVLATVQFDFFGNGHFKIGSPDFYFLNWNEGDIFNGANPNRVEFSCQIYDINDNDFTLSHSETIEFRRVN